VVSAVIDYFELFENLKFSCDGYVMRAHGRAVRGPLALLGSTELKQNPIMPKFGQTKKHKIRS
jgi:hypothetical protein